MMPGFLPFVGRAGSAGVLCVSVCLAACQLNKDLDGYAHGGDATVGDADLGDGLVSADAHDDVSADQGPEAGVVYEPCGNGTVRCAAGVLQDLCSNGKWRVIKNCAGSGMLCNALGKTCVPKCKEDRDCKDSDRETGEFCRGDGRCASKVFETVWEVDGSDRSITLPFYNDGTRDLKCDFKVLWGDESVGSDFRYSSTVLSCDKKEHMTHVYAKPGVYYVKVIGEYNGWGVNTNVSMPCANCVDCPLSKLKKVLSFGPVGLTHGAFACTSGLRLPRDEVPDASKWTNGSATFYLSDQNSGAVSKWDTSNLTTMDSMFFGATAFNQSLVGWDTSKVRTMKGMFAHAGVFDQPVGRWDTSSVESMKAMFAATTEFDQSLERWNVSSVTNMEQMFAGAKSFSRPLGGWNTSKVTTMEGMFKGATSFNGTLASWDTSSVTNMAGMFEDARSFNRSVQSWNTSKVKNMEGMFKGAISFNQPLLKWDTSQVTTMERMFQNAKAFNQPLREWDTSNVIKMSYMFFNAIQFDQNLSNWSMNSRVDLENIFIGSGLTRTNYCKLVLLPVWREKHGSLGKDYVCS